MDDNNTMVRLTFTSYAVQIAHLSRLGKLSSVMASSHLDYYRSSLKCGHGRWSAQVQEGEVQ